MSEPLMTASVEISADTSQLNRKLDRVKTDALATLAKAEQEIRAQMARNSLSMKADSGGGGYQTVEQKATTDRLAASQAQLKIQLDQVTAAFERKAQILLAVAQREEAAAQSARDHAQAIRDQAAADKQADQNAAASLARQKQISIEQMADRQLLKDTTKAILAQEAADAKAAAAASLANQKRVAMEQISDRQLLKDTTKAILTQEEADAKAAAAASLARQKRVALEQIADRQLLRDTTRDINARDETAGTRRVGNHSINFAEQTHSLNTAMPAVQKGARNSAFAFLELSRAVEDAQYGFNGMVNNIPGLVMALGGGAGLAGSISFVGVGINMLVKNYDDVAKLWRSEATQKEAERMKRLAEYTKEAAEQQKNLRKEKGEATDKGTSAIADAHKQVGHAVAVKDVAAAIQASGTGGTAKMNSGNAEALLARATLGEGPAIDRIKALMEAHGKDSRLGRAMAGEDPNIKPETPAELKARREEENHVAIMKAQGIQEEKDRNFRPTTRAEIDAYQDEKANPNVTDQRKQAAKEELDRKMKAEIADREQTENAAKQAADSLKNRYLPAFIKGNIQGVSNYGDEQSKIAGDLEKSGLDEEKAKQVAARVVDLMAKEAETRIASRALAGNLTPEAAAAKELRDIRLDNIEKQKAELKKVGDQHKSSIMTGGEWLNKLQTSGYKEGGDPMVQELKTHTELLKEIKVAAAGKKATYGKRGR